MKFKISDKVLCIDDSGTWGIKEGHEYTISSLSYCRSCGSLQLSLSEATYSCNSICKCGNREVDTCLYRASRFTKAFDKSGGINYKNKVSIPETMLKELREMTELQNMTN